MEATLPYDSNGNFSLVPGYFVQNGDDVLPSQHNPPFEDVSSGLNAVLLRNGVAPWSGNANANGNKLINLAAPTNPNDAVRLTDITDRSRFKATKNGTNQSFTASANFFVSYQTEIEDVGGIYNPADGKFTPKANKTYYVEGSAFIDNAEASVSRDFRVVLLKNGTTIVANDIKQGDQARIATPKPATIVTGNSDGTDYYQVQVIWSGSASPLILGTANYSTFMAFEI